MRVVSLMIASVALGAALNSAALEPRMHVDLFKGGYATVNSYIISNGVSQVLIDAQRKSSEAMKLVERIRESGLPLTDIFITHGHTDHFTGMAYLHKEFPKARIVVASEAIKKDIRDYAIYMDSGGQSGSEPALEPALRPKTVANPGGFDYDQLIFVLPGPQLVLLGGGVLQITSDYPPTEAPHMSTLYSPDLNALFLSDLGYNHVHLWMGDDITVPRIETWRSVMLQLKARYAAANPRIYPGHGDPTDMSLFDITVRYIDDFLDTLRHARSREQAMKRMEQLYPDYAEADFFLKYSVLNLVH